MRNAYLFFFTTLLIIACSDKKKTPKGILPPPKMQEVLWDMISAGEFLNGFILTKDSVDKNAESDKKYSEVLQFHHISKEEFEKSYLYYRQHPVLMKVLLDSLSKRQIPPEELYKPKIDSTKKDTTAKHADTTAKHTDTLLKIKPVDSTLFKKIKKRKKIRKVLVAQP